MLDRASGVLELLESGSLAHGEYLGDRSCLRRLLRTEGSLISRLPEPEDRHTHDGVLRAMPHHEHCT